MFLKQPRIFEDYLYYGNYNFSYYSFFLRGYMGLEGSNNLLLQIFIYKYIYIIYLYILFYTYNLKA